MLADTHMHTSFSQDSTAQMDAMIEQSIAKGLPAVCVTDHIDWDFPEEGIVFDYDVDDYHKKINQMREQYGSRIEILMGVELGLQPQLGIRYEQLLAGYPFDYAIGSVHLVNNRDPYYPEAFEDMTDQQAYQAYFENTLENVKAFHGFDSLGHLDYIVRYGRNKGEGYSYIAYAEIIDEILKELIRGEIALEVNTAGLRKKLGFPNPHHDIIRRYRQLGGEMVTIGADAHKPAHIGYDFKCAEEILKQCGFDSYTIFRQRKPAFVKI